MIGKVIEDNVLKQNEKRMSRAYIYKVLKVIYYSYLPIRTNLGNRTKLWIILFSLLRSDRPVNEEKIHVRESQVLQRVLQRPADIFGTVKMIPHLGGDE